MYIKSPRTSYNFGTYLQPMTTEMWVGILFFAIISGILMGLSTIIGKGKADKETIGLGRGMFLPVQALTQQGNILIN